MTTAQKVELTEEWHTPILEENLRDADSGIIRNVKIIGKVSKNGRTYSDEALKEAVPLYEGIQVNIDHPSKDAVKRDRGFMEQVGVLRDVRWTPDGDFGDLHLFENHTATPLVIERAKKDKNGFGLSHHAEGTCVRTRGGEVCESIDAAHSVDIVGKPATTRGLFESEDSDIPEEKTMKKFTLKELVESHGSADEKERVSLLEDASILDREVELEEDSASVKSGFGAVLSELHESGEDTEIGKLLAAEKVLKEGVQEPEPKNTDELKVLQEQVQQLKAKNERMELEKEISTLCESESFKPDEFQTDTLMLMESADKRLKLIESWKQAGRPKQSGRREQLEDLGSYDEELAKLQDQP